MANPDITCWLLDTRALWPGEKIQEAAPEALALLSDDERETCLRKFHIRDARMSLASALLKRAYISKTLGIPWSEIRLGRLPDPVHGKPSHIPPDGSRSPLDFNVSHQAGLVALVGCDAQYADLGVDVVCANERSDYDYGVIDKDGLDTWVETYETLFSAAELWDMKYSCDDVQMLDGSFITKEDLGRHDRCVVRNKELSVMMDDGSKQTFSSDLLIDAKLRRFYTFWCYKEAYIKMTGEAMLAKWLKDVEFRNVRAPRPGTAARCSTHGTWGEVVADAEVVLRGDILENVKMEIQAFEENYMIATVVRPKKGPLPTGVSKFQKIDFEQDILAYARGNMQ